MKLNLDKIDLKQKVKLNLKESDMFGIVSSQYRDLYKVIINGKEIIANISGKFRYNALLKDDYPVVGDFVLLDRDSNDNGNAIINEILERNTTLKRKDSNNGQNQIIASNIDFIFICMSLNNDFNLRRLERYLAISWDSGATPIIILTKYDLCDDIQSKINDIESVAIGIDMLVISNKDKSSIDKVLEYLKKDTISCFVGSSGVGKSTLINNLLKLDELKTNGLRNDDKGRHTTTRRELFILENGSIVIDTPGMREISIDVEYLEKTFVDIDEIEKSCKFSDCTHTNEPGCAIKNALENGNLDIKRYNNYIKLKEENEYANMNFKEIEQKKLKKMFGSKQEYKNITRAIKNKRKYY